jgi:hypothetical protein
MSGNDNTSETVRVSAVTTTMTDNDFDLYIKGQTGAVVVNLPAVAAVQPGRPYSVVKDGAAFTVTIDGSGTETVNGATTLVLAASAFHGVILVSTGTEWIAKALY